jgi:adenylate cyclase
MSFKRISLLAVLGPALLFSLFYLADWFTLADSRVYDIFLRLRPGRERFDGVVLLDVDDAAISSAGIFPWPRNIMADALLRFKEYGVQAAVFDIEYVDSSPAQMNDAYFKQDLRADISGRFAGVNQLFSELFDALASGRIRSGEAAEVLDEIRTAVTSEGEELFTEIQALRQDNDEYLARAAALLGRAWFTLNIQAEPLWGEQAERRSRAEELFSCPVQALPGAFDGGPGKDILPVIPVLMEAARGAGFVNSLIDRDGVNRRINLIRKLGERWYPQLVFAPLMDYLGNPSLELRPGALFLHDAAVPLPSGGVEKRTIRIPLDENGAMLLDWPGESFVDSYTHFSFAYLLHLEECQREILEYLSALAALDNSIVPGLGTESRAVLRDFSQAEAEKDAALRDCSEDAFSRYLELRNRGMDRTALLLDRAAESPPQEYAALLAKDNPGYAALIMEEAEYAGAALGYLNTAYSQYRESDTQLKTALRGKFCTSGHTATGTTDLGVTPFHAEYPNTGTHAVILDTILSGTFTRTPGPRWSIAGCFFVALLTLLGLSFLKRQKPGMRIVLAFCGTALILGCSYGLFLILGVFIGPLGPALTLLIAAIIHETMAFAVSERDKQFYRRAFATYTSETVAEQIAQNPSLLQLGGSKRRMSAIFTDVQGFSTISEKLDPTELVALLNRYLTVMSGVILASEGTIDKYEGDAIIAFFGAPLEQQDHALRACLAAIIMKRLETELNKEVLEKKMSPSPLLTRIGINTGDMVAGNMGTDKKMNYTIMGDAVNLASRLEGANKQYGTWILASEDTVLDTGGRILCRKLDRVRVVGKSEPVRLYELLEMAEFATDKQKSLTEAFHQALAGFEARNWQEAARGFREVLSLENNDFPAKKYLDRCEAFMKTPPSDDWDGVYSLTEK